jgi:hypothetical protein
MGLIASGLHGPLYENDFNEVTATLKSFARNKEIKHLLTFGNNQVVISLNQTESDEQP